MTFMLRGRKQLLERMNLSLATLVQLPGMQGGSG